MNKYIGLDLGSKTIGTATSSGVIVSPGPTFRFDEYDFEKGINQLNKFLDENHITKIICGYPKNMDGSDGERVEMVKYFIDQFLKLNPKYTKEDIILVDERRTTKMARSIMIDAGLRRDKQKQHKDTLSAQLILEQYLSTINH